MVRALVGDSTITSLVTPDPCPLPRSRGAAGPGQSQNDSRRAGQSPKPCTLERSWAPLVDVKPALPNERATRVADRRARNEWGSCAWRVVPAPAGGGVPNWRRTERILSRKGRIQPKRRPHARRCRLGAAAIRARRTGSATRLTRLDRRRYSGLAALAAAPRRPSACRPPPGSGAGSDEPPPSLCRQR